MNVELPALQQQFAPGRGQAEQQFSEAQDPVSHASLPFPDVLEHRPEKWEPVFVGPPRGRIAPGTSRPYLRRGTTSVEPV